MRLDHITSSCFILATRVNTKRSLTTSISNLSCTRWERERQGLQNPERPSTLSLVIIALWHHPFPSRTRKWNATAPMVVWFCHARVGHRQGLYPKALCWKTEGFFWSVSFVNDYIFRAYIQSFFQELYSENIHWYDCIQLQLCYNVAVIYGVYCDDFCVIKNVKSFQKSTEFKS